jgi:hypothetical protein
LSPIDLVIVVLVADAFSLASRGQREMIPSMLAVSITTKWHPALIFLVRLSLAFSLVSIGLQLGNSAIRMHMLLEMSIALSSSFEKYMKYYYTEKEGNWIYYYLISNKGSEDHLGYLAFLNGNVWEWFGFEAEFARPNLGTKSEAIARKKVAAILNKGGYKLAPNKLLNLK